MSESRIGSIGRWATVLIYVAAGFEVIIMITPFTAFFYSVYAPVLQIMDAHASTAWLTAFFLPHITYTGDPLLTLLTWLGPVLLGLGLLVFLVCAGQVYSAKLFRRGVVKGGLYRRVRHPQYLGLAIAGAGLLLYWPRFIILVLYLAMLFVYYSLARHEERRMTERFGEGYAAYRDRTAMFIPGNPGGRSFAWIRRVVPDRRWAMAALSVIVVTGALSLAAGLRAYSRVRVPIVSRGQLSMVSLAAAPGERLSRLLQLIEDDPQIDSRLAGLDASTTLVAYAFPQEYMMQHLIADLGEHESHHGGGESGGIVPVLQHLGQMYMQRPFRQLRAGASDARERVIVAEALTPDGRIVSAQRALDAGVLRYPLVFVDVEGDEITMVMDTPPRHTWGTIPVPAF